jgi:hypothetical protein
MMDAFVYDSYDVRHPLPILTMDVGKKSSIYSAALLVHLDRILSKRHSS